jgi:hypothetical protein
MKVHHRDHEANPADPAHHTVTWTSPEGSLLTVRIYDDNNIMLCSSGAITMTLEELSLLRDDCVRYLWTRKRGTP